MSARRAPTAGPRRHRANPFELSAAHTVPEPASTAGRRPLQRAGSEGHDGRRRRAPRRRRPRARRSWSCRPTPATRAGDGSGTAGRATRATRSGRCRRRVHRPMGSKCSTAARTSGGGSRRVPVAGVDPLGDRAGRGLGRDPRGDVGRRAADRRPTPSVPTIRMASAPRRWMRSAVGENAATGPPARMTRRLATTAPATRRSRRRPWPDRIDERRARGRSFGGHRLSRDRRRMTGWPVGVQERT